jgi:hypothetical protein
MFLNHAISAQRHDVNHIACKKKPDPPAFVAVKMCLLTAENE